MRTIYTNVNIATMVNGLGEILDGEVMVEGGKISYVAPKLSSQRGENRIDGKGGWLLPGLIDCHTHLVYGGNRAREFEMRLEGASYEDISLAGGGIMSTVRATRALSESELFDESVPRLQAMIKHGVRTVEIKSGYGLELETELRMLRVARRLGEELGVRVKTTLLAAHAIPPDFGGDYVAHVCDEIIPRAVGLADAIDAFCEKIAFSPDEVRRVFESAQRHGFSVKLHADQLSDLGGAALAASFGALSADHVEYTSEAGVKAMAENGTVAVLLPGAFYTLRETQLPPIELFRKHGVPMAVATDCNPGTSPCTSLPLMLNMACTLFRLTPTEALRGVTVNAARALGVSGGVIAEGEPADLLIYDCKHPSELCYRVGDFVSPQIFS